MRLTDFLKNNKNENIDFAQKGVHKPMIFLKNVENENINPLTGNTSTSQKTKTNREVNPLTNNNTAKQSLKTTEDKARYAINYYINRGLDPIRAASIVGNLWKESQFKTRVEGDTNLKTPSVGIAQWRRDRLDNLMSRYDDPYDFDNQLDFVLHEIENGAFAGMGKHENIWKNTNDLKEATRSFGKGFERPSDSSADYDGRYNYAKKALSLVGLNSSKIASLNQPNPPVSEDMFTMNNKKIDFGKLGIKKNLEVFKEGGKSSGDPDITKLKTPQDKARYAMSYFINKGLDPIRAASVVGNLWHESQFNTSAKGDTNLDTPSVGVAQWRNKRLDNLLSRYDDPYNLNNQLDFVLHEIGNNAFSGKQKEEDIWKTTNNLYDATYSFTEGFERPKKSSADYDGRYNYAKKALSLVGIDTSDMGGYTSSYGYQDNYDSSSIYGNTNNQTQGVTREYVDYSQPNIQIVKMDTSTEEEPSEEEKKLSQAQQLLLSIDNERKQALASTVQVEQAKIVNNRQV